MKKLVLFFTFAFLAIFLIAQSSPQGFQYQAALRNDQGDVISNTDVTIKFNIIQGTETDSPIYSETHSTTTNAFGLVNLKVGSGTTSDNFTSIDWSAASTFIQTEVDLGNGFQDFGTKQLLSVPYALYGEDADADASNEIQSLSLSGSELSISNGNSIDLGILGANTDNQVLSLADNTLSLEDGGSVDLAAYLDNTDAQTLSLTGTTLEITGGNDIDLSSLQTAGASDDQTISLADNTLTLENGGSVDLSIYLDDTDTNTQLTEAEVDAFVDNNGYLTSESDDQALSLSGNSLTLEDGGTVDLSSYLDNSDDQALSIDGNTLTLEDGGTVDLSSYLDNTDAQSLSSVLSNGTDANSQGINNLADPVSAQDAATKNYVDNNDLGAFSETSNVISAGDGDDDFVFGSNQLADDDSSTDDNNRLFFDKSKSAFRAGRTTADQWDDTNVGDQSIAMGTDAIADNSTAVAIGFGTTSSGVGSTALGFSTSATTDYALSAGNNSTASGVSSAAIGEYVAAQGYGSAAFGEHTVAKANHEFVVGIHNTDYAPAGDNTDRAFVVGNGTSVETKSDAFILYKNGNAELNGYLSIPEPVLDGQAANKSYVDGNDNDNQNLTNVLGQGNDAGASPITNLADPTNAQDAATKNYVDQQITNQNDYEADGSLDLKISVLNEFTDIANSFTPTTFTASQSQVGQSFTPTITAPILRIKGLMQFNAMTGYELVIYDGEGFSGTEILRAPILVSVIGSMVTVDVSLSSFNQTLNAGQSYTMAIEGSVGTTTLRLTDSNPYAGGIAYQSSALTAFDMSLFETYYSDGTSSEETAVYANSNSVGIGTTSPAPSAALEVKSKSGGLLMPRMSTEERDLIPAPEDGLIIYNTTINIFQGRANGNWVNFHN